MHVGTCVRANGQNNWAQRHAIFINFIFNNTKKTCCAIYAAHRENAMIQNTKISLGLVVYIKTEKIR